MSTQFEKLITLLQELFQTDQAELDFGIYRIINQRRDEINHFLDNDLLPQVQTAFRSYQAVDKTHLQKELDQAIHQAMDIGVDPETAPKVKQIKEQLTVYSVDINDLENQVYSDLYNFFRRYYDSGDFVSQRRYKDGVYAIPYEGEEVKLHWANHDQYYIKTSEYLRNYTFKLPSGNKCHFKLVEADEEKDNRKEIDDNKRVFILAEENHSFENGEAAFLFEFRPDNQNRKQNKLNQQAVGTIMDLRKQTQDQAMKEILTELATPAPTGSNKQRTLLEKHLDDYTRRNTSDYFIHKDLGKFLRRELDFYIKNEVMLLDDIENETVPRVEQYLSKIKVIRQIAHKIIDFLAQIEDFQRKLWLKKKFVVETNYCFTLDRIPEDLYPEIIANAAQHEEWVRLFAIDEIKGDLVTAGYNNPLTIQFLQQNPFLVLDTKFFDDDFKLTLFENIKELDKTIDGLLIHSENFQALSFLQNRYENTISCIYIDPPYNAKSSEILYKNMFKHSSWLSLMKNRLSLGKKLLQNYFVHFIAIDEVEQEVLGQVIDLEFPDNKKICLSIVHNPRGQQGKNVSYTHEFAYLIYPSDTTKYIKDVKRAEIDSRNLRDSGTESNRTDAATCFYPIYVRDGKIIGIGNIPKDDFHPSKSNIERDDGVLEVWPLDDNRNEKKWRYSVNSVNTIIDKLEPKKGRNSIQIYLNQDMGTVRSLWSDSKYDASEYGTKVLQSILGADSSKLFSYPKSIHTVMECLQTSGSHLGKNLFLDYFAGSGTTGHAVINLNREDGGDRKYILVEMGQYFETVLKPRIQKVIYSEDWKNGKPLSRKGSSHAFKYIKLESYEDTLNNLELNRTEQQEQALPASGAFREDYLVHYMLDIESKESLLDLKNFETPFDYKLNIASSTVGETVPTKVDLIETFNYLIGLHVNTVRKIAGSIVIDGTSPNEQKILIIWRNIPNMDHNALNDFFKKQFTTTGSFDYDVVYVNGNNNLLNLRGEDETWNVKLIEEEFHNNMFEMGVD